MTESSANKWTLWRLPPDWWIRCANRDQFFDEKLMRTDGEPREPLEVRFEDSVQEPRRECGMTEVDDEEK